MLGSFQPHVEWPFEACKVQCCVPRRPLGVSVKQSVAESKLEVIERYMDPHIDEFLNL
jgi:hypothetical protein